MTQTKRRAAIPLGLILVSLHGQAVAGVPGELDCVIHPHRWVELSSPASGILHEVLVERGASVTAGQVVARLDSQVEQATLNMARARAQMIGELNAAEAKAQLNAHIAGRISELYRKQQASSSETEEAETNKLIAEHDLKRVREEKHLAELEQERALALLKQRTLTSTVNGVVVERYKQPGEHVEDEPVLKLAQIDPLDVEVIAPLRLFNTVKPGMHAKIMLEEPISAEHTATVKIVDRVIDAASGTFRMRLELPNPSHAIPAGIRCEVTLNP